MFQLKPFLLTVGILGLTSFTLVNAQPPDRPGRGGPPPQSMMQRIPLFMALDTNADGKISDDELKNAEKSLRSLDKNGDNELTLQELKPDFAAAGLNRPERNWAEQNWAERSAQGRRGGDGYRSGPAGRPGDRPWMAMQIRPRRAAMNPWMQHAMRQGLHRGMYRGWGHPHPMMGNVRRGFGPPAMSPPMSARNARPDRENVERDRERPRMEDRERPERGRPEGPPPERRDQERPRAGERVGGGGPSDFARPRDGQSGRFGFGPPAEAERGGRGPREGAGPPRRGDWDKETPQPNAPKERVDSPKEDTVKD